MKSDSQHIAFFVWKNEREFFGEVAWELEDVVFQKIMEVKKGNRRDLSDARKSRNSNPQCKCWCTSKSFRSRRLSRDDRSERRIKRNFQ